MSLNHYPKMYLVKAKITICKPNNSNTKNSATARSYLDNNFYYVNDLLIIIYIK